MDNHTPPTDQETEEGTPETIHVRQGISGQGVRYVLGFGLACVVLAFIVLALWSKP